MTFTFVKLGLLLQRNLHRKTDRLVKNLVLIRSVNLLHLVPEELRDPWDFRIRSLLNPDDQQISSDSKDRFTKRNLTGSLCSYNRLIVILNANIQDLIECTLLRYSPLDLLSLKATGKEYLE